MSLNPEPEYRQDAYSVCISNQPRQQARCLSLISICMLTAPISTCIPEKYCMLESMVSQSCASLHAASLSTLATYLKASAPAAIADALEQGTFQQLLDLRRTLHLSNATIGYLQAFVQSSRNPTKVFHPQLC